MSIQTKSKKLEIQQGETYTELLTITDDAGNPVDLTGYVARSKFRKSYSSTDTVFNLTVAGGIVVDAAGTVELQIAPALSNGQKFKHRVLKGVYDVEIESPEGIVTRVYQGTFELIKNVTIDVNDVIDPSENLSLNEDPALVGLVSKIDSDIYITREIIASTSDDLAGISVQNGAAILANPQIGLDISNLDRISNVAADDDVIVFDQNAGKNVKSSIAELTSLLRKDVNDADLALQFMIDDNSADILTTETNLTITNDAIAAAKIVHDDEYDSYKNITQSALDDLSADIAANDLAASNALTAHQVAQDAQRTTDLAAQAIIDADQDAALDLETTTRIDADVVITNTVSANETARDAQRTADLAAQSDIDDAQNAALDLETTTRIDADLVITNTVSANETARDAQRIADLAAQSDIDDAQNAALVAETTARTDADLVITNTVSANETARDAQRIADLDTQQLVNASLSDDIDDIDAARVAADTQLQTNIDSETTARIDADLVITNTVLANETARDAQRITDLAAQNTALTTETNTRVAQDLLIRTDLDDLTTIQIAKNASLDVSIADINTNIGSNDSDIAALQASDVAINTRIDNANDATTALSTVVSDNKTDTDIELAAHDVRLDVLDIADIQNVKLTDDQSIVGHKTFVGDVTVEGTATLNNVIIKSQNELDVGDNIIVLAAEETGIPSVDAGIEIERGTETNAQMLWNEAADAWTAGIAGSLQTISYEGHVHNASDVTAGVFDDARISESSVSQHEASLTIAQSQVVDLDSSLASKEDVIVKNTAFNKDFGTVAGTVTEANDSRLSDARAPTAHNHVASEIISGTFNDARISESSVTQHTSALSVTESQVTDLDKYTKAEVDAVVAGFATDHSALTGLDNDDHTQYALADGSRAFQGPLHINTPNTGGVLINAAAGQFPSLLLQQNGANRVQFFNNGVNTVFQHAKTTGGNVDMTFYDDRIETSEKLQAAFNRLTDAGDDQKTLTTKSYVDQLDSGNVKLSGGTLTGNLTVDSGASSVIATEISGAGQGGFRINHDNNIQGYLVSSSAATVLRNYSDGANFTVGSELTLGNSTISASVKMYGVDSTDSTSLTTRGYVDDNKLDLTGGVLSGALSMFGDSEILTRQIKSNNNTVINSQSPIRLTTDAVSTSIHPNDLINKGYVDTFLSKSGGTVTGDLTMLKVNPLLSMITAVGGGNYLRMHSDNGEFRQAEIIGLDTRLVLRRPVSGDAANGVNDISVYDGYTQFSKEVRGVDGSNVASFTTKGYVDSNYLNLTGAQTIAGAKSFAADPAVVKSNAALSINATSATTPRLYLRTDGVLSFDMQGLSNRTLLRRFHAGGGGENRMEMYDDSTRFDHEVRGVQATNSAGFVTLAQVQAMIAAAQL